MKKLYLTALITLCSGWVWAEQQPVPTSSAQTEAQSEKLSANTIRIFTRPEIMGLWGMEIPNNKKCVEYYNFRNDNEIMIKSGQEWSYALYDYQPSDDLNDKLPALIMQVRYDNNQTDCSGRREDQTGEISQYFVQWKNTHTINFCATEKGQECFATLKRILP